MSAAMALAAGFLLDILVGDPQWKWHPVRLIGWMISIFEQRMNQGRYRKWKGALFLSMVVAIASVVVLGVTAAASAVHSWLGILVASVLIYFALSVKCLADEASKIARELKEGDIKKARHSLSMIVGRDTDNLDEAEIVRATVETVAESTMDGIVSPLFYAALLGPMGAWIYKSVNTLDSMVGHKTERYKDFGWASAKCDAFLNWLPSKVTASLISLSFGFSRYALSAWRWTGNHLLKGPELNGDTAESAMAGGLGVRLGGKNFYKGCPVGKAFLGEAIENLSVSHIYHSIKVSYTVAVLMLLLAVFVTGKG